jgi:hypothetical protein
LRKALFFHRQRVFSPLAVEYPLVYHAQDAAIWQYDGAFETGMTVCVGDLHQRGGGRQGVKLEQPMFIGEDGGGSAAMRIPIREGANRLKSFI